jgi:hypothetical protein
MYNTEKNVGIVNPDSVFTSISNTTSEVRRHEHVPHEKQHTPCLAWRQNPRTSIPQRLKPPCRQASDLFPRGAPQTPCLLRRVHETDSARIFSHCHSQSWQTYAELTLCGIPNSDTTNPTLLHTFSYHSHSYLDSKPFMHVSAFRASRTLSTYRMRHKALPVLIALCYICG